MKPLDRDDIHLITRHSNWTDTRVDNKLRTDVYPTGEAWDKFLRILFLSLSVVLSVAGVVFFFAYNWDDIHKFAKLGLIEGVVLVTALVGLFSKLNILTRKILLTGTCFLVGVMFTVFGQIYQTGANAYDLFFGWTLAITLFIFALNFAPAWLMFLALINTTFILYTEQVNDGLANSTICVILYGFNCAVLLLFVGLSRWREQFRFPSWFYYVIALAVIGTGTVGSLNAILDHHKLSEFTYLFIAMLITYPLGILYALRAHSIFYFSIVLFSLIVIFTAAFGETFDWDKTITLFILTVFVVGSTALLVSTVVKLQRKWKHDE